MECRRWELASNNHGGKPTSTMVGEEGGGGQPPAVTAEEMDAMLNQAFTEYDQDQSGCVCAAR